MRKILAAATVFGAALLVWVILPSLISAQRNSVLQVAEDLARDGNLEAQNELARFRAFAAQAGVDFRRPREERVYFSDSVQGWPLFVKGIRPFYLKLTFNPNFESMKDLEAYVRVRRLALLSVAAGRSGSERLTVALSPKELLPLDQFLQIVDSCELGECSQLFLEVHRLDQRFSSLILDSRGKLAAEILRFDGSSSEFRDVLVDLVLGPADRPKLIGPKAGVDRGELRFFVTFAMAAAPAARVNDLLGEGRLLLADPVDDVAGPYRWQAMDIRCEMPHLLAESLELAQRQGGGG